MNYYNERRHHQGIQNDFSARRYQRFLQQTMRLKMKPKCKLETQY